MSKSINELLQQNQPVAPGYPLELIKQSDQKVSLTYSGLPADHPSYAWFEIANDGEQALRLATKYQLDQLIERENSQEELIEVLLNNLPEPSTVGTVQAAESRAFRNRQTEDPKQVQKEQSEMDGLQTAAEAMLTVDEGIISAIQATFGDKNKTIDPAVLAPRPVGYEFKDPENSEKTIFRPLTNTIFNHVGGNLMLIQSMVHRYDDITAKKPSGELIITTFKAEINQEAMIEIKRSFKMSKLGISFGFNFSSLLPPTNPQDLLPKKKALDSSNVVKEGDPAFSNGKPQDFTFGLEQIKIHAKLMLKAYRKLEGNFDANPPVRIPF